jgi:hypothetical protein
MFPPSHWLVMDQFDNLLGIEVLESLQPSGRTSSQENDTLRIYVLNSWFSALLLRVSGSSTLRLEHMREINGGGGGDIIKLVNLHFLYHYSYLFLKFSK